MGGGVRGIRELRGHEAARRRSDQFLGLRDGAGHALRPFGQHQLCAEGAHEPLPLDRHGVRHDDDRLVAACGGQCAQAHARVAARGLDDGRARRQGARSLGSVQHGLRHAVLHRPGRVAAFDLAQHRGSAAEDAAHVQKRGVADQLVDARRHMHAPARRRARCRRTRARRRARCHARARCRTRRHARCFSHMRFPFLRCLLRYQDTVFRYARPWEGANRPSASGRLLGSFTSAIFVRSENSCMTWLYPPYSQVHALAQESPL